MPWCGGQDLENALVWCVMCFGISFYDHMVLSILQVSMNPPFDSLTIGAAYINIVILWFQWVTVVSHQGRLTSTMEGSFHIHLSYQLLFNLQHHKYIPGKYKKKSFCLCYMYNFRTEIKILDLYIVHTN